MRGEGENRQEIGIQLGRRTERERKKETAKERERRRKEKKEGERRGI